MVNGKIITTMPVVKQQATLYFLERGTNQFELSLADDNGVLRTLAGSASGSAVQQTLSQVLATGNKLEGKEIEGDLVVRNTYTSGGSTTGGYRISGNNEGIELSGSGEGYSSILKVGGSWNAVRGDFYYPVDTGTSSGYWQVGARGIQLDSEVPDHSMGTQFRATDKELFYTRYIDGKSPLTFTIQDSGIHSQFPDVELGGDNYITFYINSTNGMFLSKYIKPTRDEEYTQKKYVDDKIAAIGSGGGSGATLPANNATIDSGGLTGNTYSKTEVDTKLNKVTFKTITVDNGSTYVPKPISFIKDGTDPDSIVGSAFGEIGIHNWSMYWGNYNKDNTGTYNLQLGVNNSSKNVGEQNTILGSLAFNASTKGSYNTIIGTNAAAEILAGTNLTIVGQSAGRKLLNQDRSLDDLKQISPIFEEYITGRYNRLAPTFGYDTATNRLTSSNSVYLGSNIGNVLSSRNPGMTTTVGSIWIGANSGGGIQYRDYNNIVIGSHVWTRNHFQLYNSIILGNHIDIDFHKYNVLAIHNSGKTRTTVSNSLIYGEFDDRLLQINGKFNLNPTYISDIADKSTAKALVMNNDGKVYTTPLDSIGGGSGSGSGGITQVEVKNKLKGKKVAIFGDSITNFGTTSDEYNAQKGFRFENMWTGVFFELTGAEKTTINAISGSKVAGTTYDAFAYSRAEQAAQDAEYILIFMGANDQREGNAKLGTLRPKNTLDKTKAENYATFTEAYQIGLEKLLKRHKNIGPQVILMTPMKSFNKNSQDDINPDSDAYAERVIEIAKLYGLRYIDMRGLGITNYNHGYYMSDGLHPNIIGQEHIGNYVVSKLMEFGVLEVQGGGGSSVDAYTKAETDAKIKDIVVGGNNLVKNTSLPIFGQNGPDTGTPEVMKDATGYFVRYTPSATSTVGLYGKRVEGSNLGNHSRGIDVRHSHTSNVTVWGQQVAPNKWVRIKQESFTAPNEFASITTDVPGVALDLRNYKIELGSKATDWSPNIEEFSTATGARKIDEVFTISQEGIEASRVGTDVVFTGVPYAKYIAVILEFYLIFADGVATKVENAQITNDGGIKFPATLAARDIVKKFYLKALIK